MLSITDQSNVVFSNLIIQNLVKNNAVGISTVCSNNGTVQNLSFKLLIIRGINWTANAATKPSSSKNSQPFIAYGQGVTAANAMSNIIVDSCQLYNNITGFSENLSFDGNISNITITHNIVHDNTNIGIDVTGNYNECQCNDTAIDHGRNAYIAYNNCYNNNISNYATSSGIYIDGGANILIEKNISHHNGSGIELGCEQNGTSYNLIVRDNLIYDNQEPGMAIGGYDVNTTGIISNAIITNNTFVANNYANDGTGELDITKVSGCTIKNNIFYTNNQNTLYSKEAITPQTGLLLDYNDWYTPGADSTNININWSASSLSSFASYRTTSGFEKHSLFASPMMVDAHNLTAPNFHLTVASPCINKADPTHILASNETDFDGGNRIINGIMDIGAYEYLPIIEPVTLASFTATSNGKSVEANWQTATEQNTGYFILQHSVDGLSFITIGTVNVIGSGANRYQFIDPSPTNGSNYYRLKSVDKDGTVGFSQVISIQFALNNAQLTLYPNPAKDKVTIRGSHIASIQVLDNTSKLIKHIAFKDATNPTFSVNGLSAGVYHLLIQTTDNKTGLIGMVKE